MNISTLLAPFVALFRNRTFVTALIGAVVAAGINLVPSVAPLQELIVNTIVALVLLSAGGEIVQNLVTTTTTAKVEALKAQATIAQAESAKAQAIISQTAPLGSWTPGSATWTATNRG